MLLEAGLAFAGCAVALAVLLKWRALLPMDHPNARSLHVQPTPRIGGLGLIAGVALATAATPAPVWSLLAGAGALAALSLVDDARGLPAWLRFLGHFGVALTVLTMLGVSGWQWVGLSIAVVWMTNLYNFMDGSDGLAGGMALVGFGACALAAGWAGAWPLAALALAVAAAASGFLLFNAPPARLFMGDAGSIPLGFLAAMLGVAGAQQGAWPGWFVPLVFAPFIVDATLTLLRRLAAGEKIWQAHRSHYYQRAVRLGLSKARLLAVALVVMLASAALALLVLRQPAAWPALVVFGALFTVLLWSVDRRWRAAMTDTSRHAD